MKKLFPALSALLFSSPLAMSQATITKEPFGNLKDGRAVSLYTLAAKDGASVRITNFGGIIVSIDVPDRSGKLDSVVLGKDSIAEYEAGHPFFGCLTGRYANRIAKGKFTLDGTAHFLAVNNGPNSLHGGKEGFDKKLWSVKSAILKDGAPTLVLAYSSPDGEENYPGKLDCEVTYSFNDQHELSIVYSAVTDRPTVVNLTNHSYFNLAGHGQGTILDHILEMPCGSYTDTDATLIPTGEVLSVTGTPLDFLKPTRIGDRIAYTDRPLDALTGADALVICTEWQVFRNPDFQEVARRLNQPVVFDGRNLYDLDRMQELGFTYTSIGRRPVVA